MGNLIHGKSERSASKMAKAAGEEKPENLVQETAANENIKLLLSSGKFEELWRISNKQKRLLRESWTCIYENLESIGVVTFLKLFETHPAALTPFIQEVFTVKEMELNEWYRENLKVHSIRVMAIVEKVMHRLDNEVSAGGILVKYGCRHQRVGVTPDMLEKMGRSFVIAIQPSLEEADNWNSEVEDAWLALFRFIVFCMKVSYGDPEKIFHEQLQRRDEIRHDQQAAKTSSTPASTID